MVVGSERTDVCVVGAGVAGLAAARTVAAAGLSVVVVEASAQIGGRARSIPLGAGMVDPGAFWIHHPHGNPLSRLCDEHDLERMAFDLDRLTETQQFHGGAGLSGAQRDRIPGPAAATPGSARGWPGRPSPSSPPRTDAWCSPVSTPRPTATATSTAPT